MFQHIRHKLLVESWQQEHSSKLFRESQIIHKAKLYKLEMKGTLLQTSPKPVSLKGCMFLECQVELVWWNVPGQIHLAGD